MFAGDVEALVADPNGLSEYEIERVERIRRNREIMKRLGLGDHDIVSAARQRCGVKDGKVEVKRRSADEKSEIALDALGAWIAERAAL